MEKYFYIKELRFNKAETMIIKFIGYRTDYNHTMFLPSQELSRRRVITLMKKGTCFFMNKGNQRKYLNLGELNDIFYIKIDDELIPFKEKKN
jgi:hypothetical protein